MRLLLLALTVLLLCSPILAWGAAGHRITGRIASAFYDRATNISITKMLNNGNWWDYTTEWPLGAIAWPDSYGYTTAGLWSSDIHFAQTNGYPDFTLQRDCWNRCAGNLSTTGYCTLGQPLAQCCVVAAVEKYRSELWLQVVAKQTNASSAVNNTSDPLIKLLLLAHLIGDLHQPLHVDIRPNDRGGNEFLVSWYGNSTCAYGNPCDLHAVWDTYMIEKRLLDYGPPPSPTWMPDPREEQFANDIISQMNGTCCDGLEGHNDAVHWAQETIVLSSITYAINENSNISDEYVNASIPVIEEQLYRAGRRIADAMSFIFSGKVKECSHCKWWPPMCYPTGSAITSSQRRQSFDRSSH